MDGPNNDVLDIYLNGQLIGTSTSFENYFDSHPSDLNPAAPTSAQQVQTGGIFFRLNAAGGAQDGPGGSINQGFLIDNISITSFNGANATGNADTNVITGNSGDNVIAGLAGNDLLIGGAGADLFVFAAGHGSDTIQDFVIGADKIQFQGAAISGMNFASLGLVDDGGDTIISTGLGTITLIGLHPGQLSSTDFVFS